MARNKVKIAFITNHASRKAAYRKRKKGLLKKVSELSTLCGIETCAIVNSPYDAQPEVWPNVPEAQRVISKLKRLPEMEQRKNMMDQESFIKQRIMKATDQLKKQKENNKEKEMTEVMYRCLAGADMENMGMGEVVHLERVLDQNLYEVSKRIELLAQGEDSINSQPSFDEWVNQNPNENMGFVGGIETMFPIEGNNNVTWSNAHFPNF